mgnify:CR=1 FL=1
MGADRLLVCPLLFYYMPFAPKCQVVFWKMKYGFQRQRILGDAAIFMPLYLWTNCESEEGERLEKWGEIVLKVYIFFGIPPPPLTFQNASCIMKRNAVVPCQKIGKSLPLCRNRRRNAEKNRIAMCANAMQAHHCAGIRQTELLSGGETARGRMPVRPEKSKRITEGFFS